MIWGIRREWWMTLPQRDHQRICKLLTSKPRLFLLIWMWTFTGFISGLAPLLNSLNLMLFTCAFILQSEHEIKELIRFSHVTYSLKMTEPYPHKLLKRQMNNQLLICIASHAQPRISNEQIAPGESRIFISGVTRRFIQNCGEVNQRVAVFGWRWLRCSSSRNCWIDHASFCLILFFWAVVSTWVVVSCCFYHFPVKSNILWGW